MLGDDGMLMAQSQPVSPRLPGERNTWRFTSVDLTCVSLFSPHGPLCPRRMISIQPRLEELVITELKTVGGVLSPAMWTLARAR